MTLDELFARLTPGQRAYVKTLAAQWKAFKAEVERPVPVEELEPVLASPRSSLDPRFITPEHEVADV